MFAVDRNRTRTFGGFVAQGLLHHRATTPPPHLLGHKTRDTSSTHITFTGIAPDSGATSLNHAQLPCQSPAHQGVARGGGPFLRLYKRPSRHCAPHSPLSRSLQHLIHQLTMAQVNEDMLLKLFKAIDTDNSGTLSAKEILAVLNDPKLKSPKKHTLKEVEDLVGAIDSSGDGKVDFKEFLQVFKSK
ncbi:uncharacterized protein LOC144718955 [Lampetra planeri]